jgi:hypothetical protein
LPILRVDVIPGALSVLDTVLTSRIVQMSAGSVCAPVAVVFGPLGLVVPLAPVLAVLLLVLFEAAWLLDAFDPLLPQPAASNPAQAASTTTLDPCTRRLAGEVAGAVRRRIVAIIGPPPLLLVD